MKPTKEQLEQAIQKCSNRIKRIEKMFNDVKPEDRVDLVEKHLNDCLHDEQTILQVLENAIKDEWNYNMDEAPTDGTSFIGTDGENVCETSYYLGDFCKTIRYGFKAGFRGDYFKPAYVDKKRPEVNEDAKQPTAWKHLPKITKENENE